MDDLFLQILNMSITSSYVILFVIAIRFLLKRAPKIYSYSLWSVVLLRLVFPFSFESIFSLISINPKAIPTDIMYTQTPQINSGIGVIDNVVNNSLPAATTTASVNPMQVWLFIGEVIWIVGIAALIIYSIVTTIKLSNRLKLSTHVSDNIYKIDHIKTPFVFGLIKPKIYLPMDLSENEKSYIIKHEETHIKRYDHIIKFIAFVVVSIHWFNPLVWLAFILMSKDMELSCDEKVIKELGSEIKKDYSKSLLSLSIGKRIIGGSPLAFGENNTKGRIKNVLNYKKPKFWVTLMAIIVILIAATGLLSDPISLNDHIKSEYANGIITTSIYIKDIDNVESTEFRYIIPFLDQYENVDPRVLSFSFPEYESVHSYGIWSDFLQGSKDYIEVEALVKYNDGTEEVVKKAEIKDIKKKVYDDSVIKPKQVGNEIYYVADGITAIIPKDEFDDEIVFYTNLNSKNPAISVGFHIDYALYPLKSFSIITKEKAIKENYEGFSIVESEKDQEVDESLILIQYGRFDLIWDGLYPYDLDGNKVTYIGRSDNSSEIELYIDGEITDVSKSSHVKDNEMRAKLPNINFKINNTK